MVGLNLSNQPLIPNTQKFGGGIFRRENFSDGIKHIFVFFPKVVSDLPTAHNYLVVYDFNNSIHGLSSIGKRKAPALFGVEAVG